MKLGINTKPLKYFILFNFLPLIIQLWQSYKLSFEFCKNFVIIKNMVIRNTLMLQLINLT
jgi:hypothetical protein